MKRTSIKRRTPLRKKSKKRSAEENEYMRLREEFLQEHDLCQLWLEVNGLDESDFGDRIRAFSMGCPKSNQIHHKCCGKNRKATYLRTDTWMAVSQSGHDFIHANPKLSYERGWLLKTVPEKP
jgi:hypothetical protein